VGWKGYTEMTTNAMTATVMPPSSNTGQFIPIPGRRGTTWIWHTHAEQDGEFL